MIYIYVFRRKLFSSIWAGLFEGEKSQESAVYSPSHSMAWWVGNKPALGWGRRDRSGGPAHSRHDGETGILITEKFIKCIAKSWLILRKGAWLAVKQRAGSWPLPTWPSDPWATPAFCAGEGKPATTSDRVSKQTAEVLWRPLWTHATPPPSAFTTFKAGKMSHYTTRIHVYMTTRVKSEHLKDRPPFLQTNSRNQRQRSKPRAGKPTHEYFREYLPEEIIKIICSKIWRKMSLDLNNSNPIQMEFTEL